MTLRLRYGSQRAKVVLEVIDSGEGIPAPDLERVFDAFTVSIPRVLARLVDPVSDWLSPASWSKRMVARYTLKTERMAALSSELSCRDDLRCDVLAASLG